MHQRHAGPAEETDGPRGKSRDSHGTEHGTTKKEACEKEGVAERARKIEREREKRNKGTDGFTERNQV